jgi:hypothetical protein
LRSSFLCFSPSSPLSFLFSYFSTDRDQWQSMIFIKALYSAARNVTNYWFIDSQAFQAYQDQILTYSNFLREFGETGNTLFLLLPLS